MIKKMIIFCVIALLIAGGIYYAYTRKGSSLKTVTTREITPFRGDISVTFSTTGVVEPQNRLEIKPPISGRVEEILVNEGDTVTRGQVVAWMSSTDRAALLDSARAQGEEALAYWEEVYKATPLISPINGEVIVRAVEPGQTVSATETVIVLSDRLIVKAQFDETDIGRVRLRQRTVISLDAYPDIKIRGIVDHVAYESKIVNNVTTYDVDIIPQNVPSFFRSGMSATVEVIEKKKSGVLLLPNEAVARENGKSTVAIKVASGQFERIEVITGLSDGVQTEIVSGLTSDDTVIVQQTGYELPRKTPGSNPFTPWGSKKKQK